MLFGCSRDTVERMNMRRILTHDEMDTHRLLRCAVADQIGTTVYTGTGEECAHAHFVLTRPFARVRSLIIA